MTITIRLTNGAANMTVHLCGAAALVSTHDLKLNTVTKNVISVEAADVAMSAFKVERNGKHGVTKPYVRMRRLTSPWQFIAWANDAFDWNDLPTSERACRIYQDLFLLNGSVEVMA